MGFHDLQPKESGTAFEAEQDLPAQDNPQTSEGEIAHAAGVFDPATRSYTTASDGDETPDTIYTIARRFNVSVSSLMEANGLSTPVLNPNQLLRIPEPEPETLDTEELPGAHKEQLELSLASNWGNLNWGDEEKKEEKQKIRNYLSSQDKYKKENGKLKEGEIRKRAKEIYKKLELIRKKFESKTFEEKKFQDPDYLKKFKEELNRVFNQMLETRPAYYEMDQDALEAEALFRTGLIMNARAGGGGSVYGDSPEFVLNPTFWEGSGRAFTPKGDNSAESVRNIKGSTTELECDSMMASNVYITLLDIMGEKEFNTRFPDKSKVEVSEVQYDKTRHPLMKEGFLEIVEITKIEELIPGDWVYFVNVPYYQSVSRGGLLTGENAVYEGVVGQEGVQKASEANKPNMKFSGFGLENKTYQKMTDDLADAYKAEVNSWAGNNKTKVAAMGASAFFDINPWVVEYNVSQFKVALSGDKSAEVGYTNRDKVVQMPDIYRPPVTNAELPVIGISGKEKQTIENSFPGISILVKRPIANKLKKQ